MVLSVLHSSENNGVDQLRAYCAGEATPSFVFAYAKPRFPRGAA